MNQNPNKLTVPSSLQSLRISAGSGERSPHLFLSHNLYYCQLGRSKTVRLAENSASKVKVFSELATNIVKLREQNNTYQTGKVLKAYACFLKLQALTSSGIIKNISCPSSQLLKYLQISRRTFDTRVGELIRYGFAYKVRGSLVLRSNKKILDKFDCIDTSFTYLQLSDTMSLEAMIQAHVLRLQQIPQEEQFDRNIKKVKEVYEYLQANLPRSRNLRSEILNQQKRIFIHGTNDSFLEYVLNLYNADNNIRARNIRKLFKLKSYKSVAYLKKKLAKQGVITVEKQSIQSAGRSRKPDHYYVSYSQSEQRTTWHLCDSISVNPAIYAKIGKN